MVNIPRQVKYPGFKPALFRIGMLVLQDAHEQILDQVLTGRAISRESVEESEYSSAVSVIKQGQLVKVTVLYF